MSDTVQPNILVVDDDRGILRLIEKSLRREGFSVTTADSGENALAWLGSNRPDLMLLDLKLQDMGAGDVITRLVQRRRLCPFIIITGQGDERVAVEMMKSGAMDYVVKDADFHGALPKLVTNALRQLDQERKLAQAEESLRVSEERFRVTLKHSPMVVFNQDADLRYTWAHNMPFAEGARDVLGKTDEELFPQSEADRLIQIKTRVLVSGVGIRQEVKLTVNGKQRVYDLTVEPMRDASGKGMGITGAAMDITEHKQLEREVLQISEMEQRRIGQDLHDGICQHLAGIELLTSVLQQSLKSKAQVAEAEKIAAHVREVISETRSLARGLSPVVLEAEGLMAALSELANTTKKLFRTDCRFDCPKPVDFHDLTVATHLFRIAQEAVTNAIKHGKAKEILIGLDIKDDRLVLSVKDNGVGFLAAQPAKGMGLRIMQYRAATIGATLLVQRQVASGTNIICFLPMLVTAKKGPL